ncbi:CCCH-type zinc finger-containing protein [Dictyostelium discoideum AX4]|uniref:CCCH-type zinc finger-containing protein n=1 Tax=Dictyostelium discoideum TaxID=44689 RepID=Q54FZ3_DICDI|nr:CCCH-type zinc finger-containing protein [Dictyostelium discoideum AX4]EAL62185.2 CCCH-type zinc finger-containing protein [Dictyostelium discoideum AX4]|eukprot:XP_635624.2 CCCH-type zinc finger-containing protein [Dictyostelium discoideum AX4]
MYKSKLQNQDEHLQQQQKDFPIVCENCLGDSPYLTMTRSEFDKECKICTRPYNVYRWKPGSSSRYKRTEICKTCSQVKNVCQACIHDLEFGLPVQVRDAALAANQFENSYVTDKGIEYQATENQRLIDNGLISYDNFQPSDIVTKLAKTIPKSNFNNSSNNNNNNNNKNDSNAPKICSFFQKGNCNRGDECPYRHDLNSSNTEIKDGVNKIQQQKPPKKPIDQSITTLFLGNLEFDKITEDHIKNNLFVFGNIKKVKLIEHQKCAFVTFETRESAESAIDSLFNNFKIDNCEIKLNWSKSNKPPPIQNTNNNNNNNNSYHPYQHPNNKINNNNNTNIENTEEKELYSAAPTDKPKPITIMKPMGIKSFPTFKINPTPTSSSSSSSTTTNKPYYSSMDPSNYGSKYSS